jgi:PAS domain S-box-containing protein
MLREFLVVEPRQQAVERSLVHQEFTDKAQGNHPDCVPVDQSGSCRTESMLILRWRIPQRRHMIMLSESGQFSLEQTSAQLEQNHLALKRANAQIKAVLASALDPILTIDFNGTIRSASNSVERVFGWKPHEIIGRNVNLLMPSPHREAHDGYLATYRRTGQTNILGRTREFEAVRRDGARFPIELSVSRVDVPGQAEPMFMGIIHDISELAKYRNHLEDLVRERTRQLEISHAQLHHADRLASIGTLAAGLGHDMNNVLLPIRARLDALEHSDLSTSAREQFQAVRRAIAYLQQLSDGLHLLALDPDDADGSGGQTSLAEWWLQVGSLLTKAVPKRVSFQCALDENLPPLAVAPHRLTQAVLNLVVNAGEAIRGDGMIRIWARAGDSGTVTLGVTDSGEGMTPEVQRHALDPFFTTKKRGLGTGLGLSLVRGVAQAAGGTVQIDSEPGKGTTVILTFPTATMAAEESESATAVVSIRDRRAASFVSALLQSAGFNVTYSNGAVHHGVLWLLGPEECTVSAVQDYLQGDPCRRVILFGAAGPAWKQLNLPIIDDPMDFESIRSTIGVVIRSMRNQMS